MIDTDANHANIERLKVPTQIITMLRAAKCAVIINLGKEQPLQITFKEALHAP